MTISHQFLHLTLLQLIKMAFTNLILMIFTTHFLFFSQKTPIPTFLFLIPRVSPFIQLKMVMIFRVILKLRILLKLMTNFWPYVFKRYRLFHCWLNFGLLKNQSRFLDWSSCQNLNDLSQMFLTTNQLHC